MKKSKQVYYYKDELNDEFSGAKITPRIIDENYKYIHKNPLWDFCSFLLQNILSMPIKLIYRKRKIKTIQKRFVFCICESYTSICRCIYSKFADVS